MLAITYNYGTIPTMALLAVVLSAMFCMRMRVDSSDPSIPCCIAIENRIDSNSFGMAEEPFVLRYGKPSRVMQVPLNQQDHFRFPEAIRPDFIELFRDQDEIKCYVRSEHTELIGFKKGKCDIIAGISSPIPEFR